MRTETASEVMKIVLITIFPITGVDPDYDQALADIQETKSWFDQYLKKQCTALGCKVSVQKTAVYAPLPQPQLRAKIGRIILPTDFRTFLFMFVWRIW